MFFDFDQNALYAHNSLFLKHTVSKKLSFYTLDENLLQVLQQKPKNHCLFPPVLSFKCMCIKFKRILKYLMKGFGSKNETEALMRLMR